MCRFRGHPASFSKPNSRIILVQLCFDVFVLVCLFCLFSIAGFYVLLAMQRITMCYNLNLHTTRSLTYSDTYQSSY